MARVSVRDHADRIIERLRRDHPDPDVRRELYEDGKLPAYVRGLLGEIDDEAVIEGVIAEVRMGDDGT